MTSVPSVCNQLYILGRRRNQIIKRQRLINQPAEQQFVFEITLALEDSKDLSKKELYENAQRLRNLMLKHVSPTWDEVIAISRDASEENYTKFIDRLQQESGVEPKLWEITVILEQIFTVIADQAILKTFDRDRKNLEDVMESLAEELPVFAWWNSNRGCAALGLAKIVAETGNLSNYANPGKVWKRMGMAPYKDKAASTWKKTPNALTADEWVDLGYVARRRSVMYVIGDVLVKMGDIYRKVFLDRKRIEAKTMIARGMVLVASAKTIADSWEAQGLPRPVTLKNGEFDNKKHVSVGYVNLRAQRYMEKRLLKDLWIEWQKVLPS